MIRLTEYSFGSCFCYLNSCRQAWHYQNDNCKDDCALSLGPRSPLCPLMTVPAFKSRPGRYQQNTIVCGGSAGILAWRGSSGGDCVKVVSLRSHVWPLNIITAAISGGDILFWKWHSHQDRGLPVTTSGPLGTSRCYSAAPPINFRIHCRSPSFSLHLQQISRWVNPTGTAQRGEIRVPVKLRYCFNKREWWNF